MKFKKVIPSILITGLMFSSTITSFADSFTDTSKHWSRFYVERLSEEGVISGYGEGEFKPDNSITREEVSTILSKYIGAGKGSKSFKDIEGRWSQDYITGLLDKGLISGYPDGTFKPTNNITRAEFATMICNYLEQNNKLEKKNDIILTDIGGWAADSIRKVVESGYMSGYENGLFKPNNYITRAEVSTVIALIDGAYKTEDITDSNIISDIENLISDAFPDYLQGSYSENSKEIDIIESVGKKLWATSKDSFGKDENGVYTLKTSSDSIDEYTMKYFNKKFDHSSSYGIDYSLLEGKGGILQIKADGSGNYVFNVVEYNSLNKKYKLNSIKKVDTNKYLCTLKDNGIDYQIIVESNNGVYTISEILN